MLPARTSHLGFETTVTFAEEKMYVTFYIKTEKRINVYFDHCNLTKPM